MGIISAARVNLPKEWPPNDNPEELDGYQLERCVAGDQELPIITYSVVEIDQPDQNKEENHLKHTEWKQWWISAYSGVLIA